MPRLPRTNHGDDQSDYSPTEAAGRLGISRATAYNEIKAGRMATTTNELGHMRVTHDELERYRLEELPKSRARINGTGGGGGGGANSSAERQMRAERGAYGGHMRAARLPREELNRHMREGFRHKLEEEVDPYHTLRIMRPDEFNRKVDQLQQAHMAKMRMAKAQRQMLHDQFGRDGA